MKVAVITPYYKEPREKLERCMKSVVAQTYPVTHYMVADGFPKKFVEAANVKHITLPNGHGDNGNTPRGIGAMCALNSGFEAFAFLDADNWFAPDHVASLIETIETTGAHVAFSDRYIVLPDGEVVPGFDSDDADRSHADTSAFFITDKAAFLLPYWAMMDKPTSPICDRIMYQLVRKLNVPMAYTGKQTLYYESNYGIHFRKVGRPAPANEHVVDFHKIAQNQSAERSWSRTRFNLTVAFKPTS